MSSFPMSLQHFVTIQVQSSTKDAAGQRLTGWTNLGQEWADIRHTGGLEAIRAGADTSKVNASIRMRYRDDLNSGMRVVYGTTIYEIVAPLPDANRVFLDLVAQVVS